MGFCSIKHSQQSSLSVFGSRPLLTEPHHHGKLDRLISQFSALLAPLVASICVDDLRLAGQQGCGSGEV
jgi:hypothetical protein